MKYIKERYQTRLLVLDLGVNINLIIGGEDDGKGEGKAQPFSLERVYHNRHIFNDCDEIGMQRENIKIALSIFGSD